MARYRIRAWGSATEPDIDLLTDEVPTDLTRRWPMVDVARLEPVRLSAVMAALEQDPPLSP